MLIVTVAIGGMIGAYARWWLAGLVYERLGVAFPWGTLAVNVMGSFMLGLLLPLLAASDPRDPVRAFLVIGVVGSFTTFSTFAYEAVMLVQDGERRRAAWYAAASVGLGLAAIITGLRIGSAVH